MSPGLFLSLGAPGLDSLIPGPGQILYQILTQNGSPGLFRSPGAPGLDSLIPGPGQSLYQILSQNVSPGLFLRLGAPGLDFGFVFLGLFPGLDYQHGCIHVCKSIRCSLMGACIFVELKITHAPDQSFQSLSPFSYPAYPE